MNIYTNSAGRTYYLHSSTGKNGTVLYFFSRKEEGSINVPDGYSVIEAKRSKMPMLKKK